MSLRDGLRLLAALALLMAGAGTAPAQAAPLFSPLPAEMSTPRYMPSVATLPSGKVLIAGGYTGKERVKSAELFDPATGAFEALSGELAVGRAEAATIALPNGKVLLAGGDNTKFERLKSAELFNPTTGKFEPTAGELAAPRDAGAAALLPGGKVLLVGGEGTGGVLKSAEVFDPATGKFEALSAEMGVRRYTPVAATLPDGKVLIAGGLSFEGGLHGLISAELFNPGTGEFEALAATMAFARGEAGSAPLPNGAILIVGGWNPVEHNLSSTEVFSPATGEFQRTGDLKVKRDGPGAAALQNGTVLIVGGATQQEFEEGGELHLGPSVYLKSAELASSGAPAVATGAASSVATTTATLNGSVLSEAPGTAYFQYGPSAAYGASTAQQGVAATLGASALSAGIAGLAPATTYHFRLVASNAGGVSYGADQTFTTAGSVPSSSGPLITAPAITGAAQSAARWREGNKLARISRHKAPLGTTFSISVNTQATVTFRFTQTSTGRKVGGACVQTNKRNARRRACRRTTTAGTLGFAGHAGVNKVAFQGRLSSSRKLRPGRYTLIITASNAAGRARPVRLTFTIVR